MIYKIRTELLNNTILYYFDNEETYNTAQSIETSPDASTEQLKNLASNVIAIDHPSRIETLLKSRYSDTLENILDYYVGRRNLCYQHQP